MTGAFRWCLRNTEIRFPVVAATGAPRDAERFFSPESIVRMIRLPSAVTTYGRASSRSTTTRVTAGLVLCCAVRTRRTPFASTVAVFDAPPSIVPGKSITIRFGFCAVSTVGFTGALRAISTRTCPPSFAVVTCCTFTTSEVFCAIAQDNMSNVTPRCF